MLKKILLSIIGIFLLLFLGYTVLNFHSNMDVKDLKKDFMYEDSKLLDIVGMKVHYRITGEGDPLVLLHGTGASLHTWEQWTEELSKDFKVISLDLPAFGLTGKHYNNDYSIKAYTTFLNSFLNKIGVKSCYLAGNSLGGRIAWGFTLDYPEKVKRLILLDAAGFPAPDRSPPLAFRLAANPLLSKYLLKITPKSLFVKSLTDVYHNDDLVTDELIDRYFKLYLRRGNRQAFIDRVNQKFVDRTNELGAINIPTLILWGKQDHWVPVGDAQKFKDAIPNSEVIIYPNAGHIPMEELPTETAQDARIFLLK